MSCQHDPRGEHCLVAHMNQTGKLLPACRRCIKCGEWLAYDDLLPSTVSREPLADESASQP